VLVDSFDYSNGSITAVSSGKWRPHSGTNNGPVKVSSGRVFLSLSDAEDVNAEMAGQPFQFNSSAVLYARLMVNFTNPPSPTGAYFIHFRGGDEGGNSHYCRVFAFSSNAPAGHFYVGIANHNEGVTAKHPAQLSTNTDYTLVVRYVVSNATSTIWVNPTSESDTGVTAPDSHPPIDVFDFAFRQTSGIGRLFIDNLLVATHWPLNPSLTLLSDGATGYLIRVTSSTESSYRLQRAPAMAGPWEAVATQTAPHSGLLEFHEDTPAIGQAFYRTIQP